MLKKFFSPSRGSLIRILVFLSVLFIFGVVVFVLYQSFWDVNEKHAPKLEQLVENNPNEKTEEEEEITLVSPYASKLREFRNQYAGKYFERIFTDQLSPESTSTCKLPESAKFFPLVKPPKKFVCDYSPRFSFLDRKKKTIRIDNDICEGGVVEINYVEQLWRAGKYKPRKWIRYEGTDEIKMESNFAEVRCKKFVGDYKPVSNIAGSDWNYYTVFDNPPTEYIEKQKRIVRNKSADYYDKTVLTKPPDFLLVKLESVTRHLMFDDVSLNEELGQLLKDHYNCWDEEYCTHRSAVFNRYTVHHPGTASVLVALLGGERYTDKNRSDRLKTYSISWTPKEEDIMQYAEREHGYIVSFGSDSSFNFGGTYDYPFNAACHLPMFHAVEKTSGYHQRHKDRGNGVYTGCCQGNEFCWSHPLNYTLDFFRSEELKDLPKFSILAHNDGHIWSPAWGAKSYEKGLVTFLKIIMKEFPNTIITIFGDHGRPFKKSKFSKGPAPHLHAALPAFAVLTPRQFADEGSDVEEYLLKNSQNLVTSYDFHRTFYSFLNYPHVERGETVNRTPQKKKYNLLQEVVPYDRSCADIGKKSCVCQMGKIVVRMKEKEFLKSDYVLANKTIEFVNKASLGFRSSGCRVIDLEKIVSVEVTKEETIINIDSSVGPSTWKARFDLKGKMKSVIQVTWYSKYAECTPEGAELQMCICKQFPEGTL